MGCPVSSTQPFGVYLGDILSFPNGYVATVRSVITFDDKYVDVAGFIVLGDTSLVVTVPHSGHVCEVFVPVQQDLSLLGTPRSLKSGVARYWPSHLPGVSGAMGELRWSLQRLDSSPTLAMCLTRDVVSTVFLPVGTVPQQQIRHIAVGARTGSEAPVVRHSGELVPTILPNQPTPSIYREMPTNRFVGANNATTNQVFVPQLN